MTSEVTIIKHTNAFQNDLFALPIVSVSTTEPSKAVQNHDVFSAPKKRKSKELNPNAPVFKRRKPNGTIYTADPEVITIDSDSDVERTQNSAKERIDSCSDNESVKICEPESETIEINDSDEDNLVININQTENVDKIVDSALGRRLNGCRNDVIESGRHITQKRTHWTQVTGFPKSWTKEMIRFYTEPCERNRVFDYEKILSKLKSKPSDWWINREDAFGSSRRRRSFEMCRKCGKFGHIARECKKNTHVCYVCGEFNHVFPNCPNTRCLTCGNSASRNMVRCIKCDRAFNRKVLCGLCKQTSHEEFMCPSKWRKHMLLDSTNETMRLNPKRFCYNCAQSGHFGFECPFTQNSMYPMENPLLTASTTHIDNENYNSVIFISKKTADLLGSATGNTFFGRLSRDMNCRIELCRGVQSYVRIIGEGLSNVRVFEEELEKLKHDSQ